MKVLVRCSYELEVEVPDDNDPYFDIEENSCPATGVVGGKLYELIDNDDGWCWCCPLKGENKIISINGVTV